MGTCGDNATENGGCNLQSARARNHIALDTLANIAGRRTKRLNGEEISANPVGEPTRYLSYSLFVVLSIVFFPLMRRLPPLIRAGSVSEGVALR